MEKLAGLISANYNDIRFGKLTAHRPIAAIPFGGRYRLIDFPLSNMVNSGMTQVGLITPHLYRSLMDHLGSGKEFGLSRKSGGLFILPGSTYGYDLGHGKFSIKDCRGNMQFFNRTAFDRLVMSTCSKIYNIDYRDVEKYHLEKEANVTFVYKKDVDADVGDIVIDFDEKKRIKGIRRLKKKEKKVNLYLDSTMIDKNVIVKIIEWYKDNSYMDVIEAIAENLGRLSTEAYEFTGYAMSINSIKDYMDASRELLDTSVMKELFLGERLVHTKIHDAPPVKYFETAKIKNAIVGTGTIIKGSVEDSIVFRNTTIGEGTKIKNSVVMASCHIGSKVVLENVICEKAVTIEDGEVHKGTPSKPVILSND